MRILLIILVACLAMPVAAQQSSVCRGKPALDLGDGAKGCLLGLGPATFTRTARRDDGQSRSSKTRAGMIVVAMYGAYSDSWSVKTPRVRAICAKFKDALAKELAPAKVNKIGVRIEWPDLHSRFGKKHPRLRPPGDGRLTDAQRKANSKPLPNGVFRKIHKIETSSLNARCRAVKHLPFG